MVKLETGMFPTPTGPKPEPEQPEPKKSVCDAFGWQYALSLDAAEDDWYESQDPEDEEEVVVVEEEEEVVVEEEVVKEKGFFDKVKDKATEVTGKVKKKMGKGEKEGVQGEGVQGEGVQERGEREEATEKKKSNPKPPTKCLVRRRKLYRVQVRTRFKCHIIYQNNH